MNGSALQFDSSLMQPADKGQRPCAPPAEATGRALIHQKPAPEALEMPMSDRFDSRTVSRQR
jgi:hypothetical protein